MNDNKTITDIIAEKRRQADNIEREMFGIGLVADFRRMLDRFEAAHKREIEATAAKCCQLGRLAGYGASEIKHQQEPVCNAAKLREAAEKTRATLEEALEILNGISDEEAGKLNARIEDVADAICEVTQQIIPDALAAPPRNCDRFATAEEAWDAYDEWAESYRAKGKTEPLNEVGWLFATATEKKGGTK